MNTVEKVFPDYFSNNAINEILKYGKDEETTVYRVAKYGTDLTVAFLNYYDETIRGLKRVRKDKKEQKLKEYSNDIDALSVSCYSDLKEILDYYFGVTLKEDYPERILLKGKTFNKYGASQLTSKRKPNKKGTHTDWWLYRDATPWTEFERVEI